ncbi:BatD family protein [Gemmatimonadota bacterium]
MRACAGLLVSLLLGSAPLGAQAPRLQAQIDTTVVTVGDRITLEIAVDHAFDARVVWPDSLRLEPFEVLEASASPPASQGDAVRSTLTLTLAAFELGDLEIPSFEVEVLDPEGGSTILNTNPFGVRVSSVGLDEGGDIRDLKGPLRIPRGLAQILVTVLAVLLGAGLGWAIYRRTRRRDEGSPEPIPAHPPRPPHEVALEALARLEGSPLLERGEVKEYHIQASEILRVYVEGRFQVPALEMTTVDITAGLRRASVEPSVLEGFGRFLHQSDMVKFAKHRPSTDGSRAILELGKWLVEETIPAAPPVERELEEARA